MPGSENSESLSLLRSTLDECRELYVSSGQLCAQQYPHLISKSGDEFVQLMDDLHRALVLKIYVVVCEADRKWSQAERDMAEVLFEQSIRRMANRIADIRELSSDQLMLLESEDIEFSGLSADFKLDPQEL